MLTHFFFFFIFFNLTRKVLGVAGARGGNDGYANTFLHMRNENSIIPGIQLCVKRGLDLVNKI